MAGGVRKGLPVGVSTEEPVDLVVLEATGGLETALVGELADGVPVAVVNPRQVRDFARALGQLAKPTPWMLGFWPTLPKPPDRSLALARGPNSGTARAGDPASADSSHVDGGEEQAGRAPAAVHLG